MDNSVNLLNKMKWLTESKALEKSKAKTVTQSASPVSSDLSHTLAFKVLSRVKNHHFSKFAIFRPLNRAHQKLSFKKISGKNVFSVQTYRVQKFFLC